MLQNFFSESRLLRIRIKFYLLNYVADSFICQAHTPKLNLMYNIIDTLYGFLKKVKNTTVVTLDTKHFKIEINFFIPFDLELKCLMGAYSNRSSIR